MDTKPSDFDKGERVRLLLLRGKMVADEER